MAKQKIVISIPMLDTKRMSKALTVVVQFPGVVSAEVKDGKLSVVGEGIDSVALTCSLRKKMCHAEIVSIGDEKEEKKKDKPPELMFINPSCSYPYNVRELYCNDSPRNTCSIL